MTLDGSQSSSDGHEITSWLWQQVIDQQTGGPTVQLTGADTATVTALLPDVTEATPVTFSLTVTDSNNNSHTASHIITINPAVSEGTAPVAVITGNADAVAGEYVIIDGRSSYDADADVLTC